ncbi:MAG: phenylalanine--tRNA ligase subunit beta [Gammaproteobacteria bacterium]
MKLSEKWLRQWVDPQKTLQEIGEQLTMAGLELESIEPATVAFNNVVIAQIKTVKQHPDADRLSVCEVDDGTEVHTVVCGGKNVRPGLKVALARVGATLPDLKIKKSKIRGVTSMGMMCSEVELKLADSSLGIMELPDDAPLGKDFREYLYLDDQVIDLAITPNRGDCISVQGIAREVAALNQLELSPPEIKAIQPKIKETLSIRLDAPDACPHYVGRIIKGVNMKARVPFHISERLRRSGLRAINPVVDVMNYVMLELGQPMHAFDLTKLQGDIHVRFAKQKETLALLNEEKKTLMDHVLVIADDKEAVAIAGVMGGLDSSVTDATKDIFLESAYFNPETIAFGERYLGIGSDSSYRFERGVDPALHIKAIERATAILLEIVGGEPGPVTESIDKKHLPKTSDILLRHARIKQILGFEIDADKVKSILETLSMAVIENSNAISAKLGIQKGSSHTGSSVCTEDGESSVEASWLVRPPSYRFDIAIEEDLIEEIIRLHGYEHLPMTMPATSMTTQQHLENVSELAHFRRLLCDRNFHEVVVYSFVDEKLQSQCFPNEKPIALKNPISQDLAVMRVSLWPGLIQTLKHNQNRQQERVRIFEAGLQFNQTKTMSQPMMLAGLITGTALPEQWGEQEREVDFYDLKGDVEALLQQVAVPSAITFVEGEHSALHPGQSAKIIIDHTHVGWIGALHPTILQKNHLRSGIYLFELNLDLLPKCKKIEYQPVSKFPSIRRDFALLLDKSVTAQQVFECIKSNSLTILEDVHLFDLYDGEKLPEDKKSLAISLILRDTSRTLVDEDVIKLEQKVLNALQSNLGAKLRD